MTLLELQRRMSNDVRRPLTSSFEMQQRTEDGQAMADLASTYIKPNDRLTSFDRLEIYNRQYWFRVIAAVSEDFPALAAVLGSKRFDALVLAYLKENPSTSFTLRNLGARLPMWLADHPEFVPRMKHALALDVAQLEWAYVESFDRLKMAALTLEDFAGLDGDSRLSLQPHLQLLRLSYPVDELVLAVRMQTPESDIMSNAVSEMVVRTRPKLPGMRRSRVFLAVHRFDNSVYYRRIDHEAYLLLSALQHGRTLGESLEAAFANSRLKPEMQAEKIQHYFAHAAELGWFCHRPTDMIGVQ
ncbi:Putative DNA-binding domain-containing protein [Granulicella rosea]|uniref:Putative DNA-binding domain-containing protein n=1 Tax=Granulicella rosea TaxID=474952 RepID=A0A239MJL0_9BACT|nr:DNA-binding domain-containing protein [Granulicella rosea]SNT42282.1 Putative DNA-binding domain-containing protein [Granulicella rosea]